MAKGVTIEVDRNNMKAIDNMFKQLPKEVSKNKTWLKFWRENSKPLQRAAKENAAKLNKSKKGTFGGVVVQSIQYGGYNDLFDDDSGDEGIYRKALYFKIRIINI